MVVVNCGYDNGVGYVHAEPFAESTGAYGYIQPSVKCCPVCKGKGTVAPYFYSHVLGDRQRVGTPPQTCRSCEGKGYIVIK